jgi:hypothetical protein
MPKSLFATFPSSDTFSQHFSGEIAAKFPAVLEAVSDCLCQAVDTNWNAINSSILDSLCQCFAGSAALHNPGPAFMLVEFSSRRIPKDRVQSVAARQWPDIFFAKSFFCNELQNLSAWRSYPCFWHLACLTPKRCTA